MKDNKPDYQIQGVIKMIGETISFPSGFAKRELVLDVPDTWRDGTIHQNPVSIDWSKEKTAMLDGYKVGEEVKVHFNIHGRVSNTGRHFVSLAGWRIAHVATDAVPPAMEEPNPAELAQLPF